MVDRKTILLRADGNAIIGLGHLYRMYALADMLQTMFHIVFLSRDAEFITENFKEMEVMAVPSEVVVEDEPKWISETFSNAEFMVVTDGYAFDSNYQKGVKFHGFSMVCVDDLASQYMYADLVINHSLEIKKENYSAEPYTQFALGSQYALIRSSFIDIAKEERNISVVDKAFICFGGADPMNFTYKATLAWLRQKEMTEVNVVIGGAYRHKSLLQINDNRLKVHENVPERTMLKIMQESNIAMAPASTICYELCSVKTPLFSGYYVDNQKSIYKGLINRDLAIGCGDFTEFDFDQFNPKLDTIAIQQMISQQAKFFDGQNRDNITSMMQQYA